MRAVGIALLLSLAVACGSSGGGTDPGPADVPPADVPPADVPPADVPPADVPPVDVPPADVPPADVPPADVPPADVPPADVPPADVPPADPGPEDAFQYPDFADVAFPPRALAFEFTRPAEGEPIPAAEVTAFTKKVAAAWKQTGYFRWILRTSMGVDPSTGKDDYLSWHNDMHAVKAGDTVTFVDPGGEHNMWIPSSKVLAEAIGGYLWTGDWEMGKVAEQYCKGLTAVVKGFVWDEDDPAPMLMARAVFPMDQSFVLDDATWKDDGRKKALSFANDTRQVEDGWNTSTFPWPHNPTWGAMWVSNMRSKDDVRAISRTTPFLFYAAEDAADPAVKAACTEARDTMIAFHKDIVDEEYFIRTKGKDGVAYRIPCPGQCSSSDPDCNPQDLGSYACYTDLDPTNECCARMSADMIAYGERRTNECGTCTGSIYDAFASAAHYYNIPIVWDYHMAGVLSALLQRQHEDAYMALLGLAQRLDTYMHPTADVSGSDHPDWWKDMALLLVQAASAGLPLTAAEARHVQKHWLKSVDEFTAWTNWDLWDASIPDGTYSGGNLRPRDSTEGIPIEGWATLLEYCASPFRNPAGAAFVDCDVLKDPSTW